MRAAQHGLPLTLAIIGAEPARFTSFVELYHRTLAEHGASRSRSRSTCPATSPRPTSRPRRAYPHLAAMTNAIGRERGWPRTTGDACARRRLDGALWSDRPTVASKIRATECSGRAGSTSSTDGHDAARTPHAVHRALGTRVRRCSPTDARRVSMLWALVWTTLVVGSLSGPSSSCATSCGAAGASCALEEPASSSNDSTRRSPNRRGAPSQPYASDRASALALPVCARSARTVRQPAARGARRRSPRGANHAESPGRGVAGIE